MMTKTIIEIHRVDGVDWDDDNGGGGDGTRVVRGG